MHVLPNAPSAAVRSIAYLSNSVGMTMSATAVLATGMDYIVKAQASVFHTLSDSLPVTRNEAEFEQPSAGKWLMFLELRLLRLRGLPIIQHFCPAAC